MGSKLKILLGNNTLSLLAGSETWTYTLALQLKKLGHSVACFSPSLGIISQKLEKAGIHCYSELSAQGVKPFSVVFQEEEKHEYDVIIANHNSIVETLREKFVKTPIISTIHGIIHKDDRGGMAPEHPALNSGVNQFVAVSEEVRDILKGQYSIDSVIVRNFIDMKRFGSLPAPKAKPEQFLVNTNYSSREDAVVVLIRETAKLMGVKVTAIGENFTTTFDIERAIKDSDVVFGMGRSVLEGVAAGRLGIVLGRWGYGGIITEGSVETIRKQNFSGRNAIEGDMLPTPEELAKQIEQCYTPAILDWGKQYIAREHNVAFAADEYLRLADELTGRTINAPATTGVNPDSVPLKKAYAN